MKYKEFSRKWPPICRPSAGFSLVELLLSLFIAGMMMTLMARFVSTSVGTRHDMSEQAEVVQGLRALLSIVTQDLHLAGACLPQHGPFIALEGTDNGAQDSLTVRTGRVDGDTDLCVVDALTAPAAVGATSVTVSDASQFRPDEQVYITTPAGANGEFYTVVTASGTTLTIDPPLADLGWTYAPGAGVFAVEEHIFSIDPDSYGRPVLMMAVDQDPAQPFVYAVDVFDVQYVLGPCALTCAATVALPADAAEWARVAEVGIKATLSSRHLNRAGAFVEATTGEDGSETEYINVKPRNALRV